MVRTQHVFGAAVFGVCLLAVCLWAVAAESSKPGRGFGRQGGPGAGGPPSLDQLFERLDTNKDGKLTKDELPPRMAEFLMRADKDGDGAITRAELAEARKNMPAGTPGFGPGGGPGMMPSVDDVFKRLDKNGDGKLTTDEIPEMMRERMKIADTNNDGVITKEELEAARQKMGEAMRAKVGQGGFDPAQMFSRLDKNGDGKLTKNELPARMAERLLKADTDGDGVITKAEFEEATKQVRGQFGRKAEAKPKQ